MELQARSLAPPQCSASHGAAECNLAQGRLLKQIEAENKRKQLKFFKVKKINKDYLLFLVGGNFIIRTYTSLVYLECTYVVICEKSEVRIFFFFFGMCLESSITPRHKQISSKQHVFRLFSKRVLTLL